MFGNDDDDKTKHDDGQQGDQEPSEVIEPTQADDHAHNDAGDWQHPDLADDDGPADDESSDREDETLPPPPPLPPHPHHPEPHDGPAHTGNDLIDLKRDALNELSPLVDQLDQSPDEKFRTLMMMIQASDDQHMVRHAYETALEITDEKERAQALLDIINEINYFTQNPTSPEA